MTVVVPGRPFPLAPGADLTGLRVTVMGLGGFSGGVETIRFLVGKGAGVLVTDLKDKRALAPSLKEIENLPVETRLGRHEEDDFTKADLVVVSPAVPPDSRYLKLAADADVPLMTELGLTMALLTGPVAWVTGTCGKSTTTALLGAILAAGGVKSEVGGNIGRALVARAESFDPDQVTVLEVSSFQLEWMARDGISPDLTVVTNLTPNHLDRHGTVESYAAAKAAALPEHGPAILNHDDPLTRERLLPAVKDDLFTTSMKTVVTRGAYLRGPEAVLSILGVEEVLFQLPDLKLLGDFNRMNALQAALAARLLRGPTGAAAKALPGFHGLPHRLEIVGEREGITGVNDSKATTPEAAVRAIRAVPGGLVLIAGGFERSAALRDFVDTVHARVKGVVLVGASAKRVAKALGKAGPVVVRADSLEGAVRDAFDLAEPGDTMLLSPAHASWDMFTSYEERGERFSEAFLAYDGS
ncbi:MAG: UDP-N-acetylmuramoyl-L-alanine--D-glutamate ligase [Planctomycetota bacterium]